MKKTMKKTMKKNNEEKEIINTNNNINIIL